MKIIQRYDIFNNIKIVMEKYKENVEISSILVSIKKKFQSENQKQYKPNEVYAIIYTYRTKGKKIMGPNIRDKSLHHLYDLMLKSRIKINNN